MQRRLLPAYIATTCLTSSEGFLSVMIAPYLDSLGYELSSIGLLVSIFSIVALVSRFPAGLLYGPGRVRLLVGAALLAMAAASVLYPLATQPLPLALVRALNGAGFGIATTLVMALFMDALPPGQSTHRPMSVFGAALAGGFAIGMGAGGWVAELVGYTDAFRISALLPLVTLVLMLDVLRKVQPRTRSESKKREALPWRARVANAGRALRHPDVVAVSLAAFLMNFLLHLGMTYFPLYGLKVGLNLAEIGLVRSAHSAVQLVSRPFVGELSSRVGHRKLMIGSLVLLGLAYMLVPAFRDVVTLAALFVLLGTLRAVGFVATTVSLAEDVPPQQMNRGVAASVFNSSKDLGNLSGPLLGGLVASAVGIDRIFLVVPPIALVLYLLVQYVAGQAARRAARLRVARG